MPELRVNQIIRGDCLHVLWQLPKATMIFADPPDNVGAKYDGFKDRMYSWEYADWLRRVLRIGELRADIFWLSYYYKYQHIVMSSLSRPLFRYRQFIWYFTFGQNQKADCASSYRPLLRLVNVDGILYPDAIRVPSARQAKYNDKRANPKGRIPDDVWVFSRVCGTFKDRKNWHPCQHPKDLLRRIVLFSTKPGDHIIDMFGGSGNMLEVCMELGRPCTVIEISKFYCDKMSKNTGVPVRE